MEALKIKLLGSTLHFKVCGDCYDADKCDIALNSDSHRSYRIDLDNVHGCLIIDGPYLEGIKKIGLAAFISASYPELVNTTELDPECIEPSGLFSGAGVVLYMAGSSGNPPCPYEEETAIKLLTEIGEWPRPPLDWCEEIWR